MQLDGLLGSHGIAPAGRLLEQVREWLGGPGWLELPTLLWLGSGDAALRGLCAAGVALSLLLLAGASPRLALAGLWASYLSFVSVGGIFLAYQWDVLLLETLLVAVWVAPPGWLPFRRPWRAPHPLAIWLPRCLLFKLMLLSGLVKLLSGDPTWRGLTALSFHFETQPIPTATSWLAHATPQPLLRIATLGSLAVELLLPPLVFAGRRARQVACAGFVGMQLAIAATGNYGFFNLLTLALCTTLLDDRALARMLPRRVLVLAAAPAGEPPAQRLPRLRRAAFAVGAVGLLLLSLLSAADRLGVAPSRPAALQALERRIAPFHLASPYGLFAVMTTERDEVEILGSDDGESWRPYVFRWKPGPLERAPSFAPLHMPRLDWQLWFAALARCEQSPWLGGLFARLLENEPAVLALLAENPFPDAPPRLVRAELWRYRFTAPGERGWWKRERRGPFCPAFGLRDGRLVVAPG